MGHINGDFDSPNTFGSKEIKTAKSTTKPFFAKQLEKRKVVKRK
ncbi:hypothetical protein [Microscilla marina]|uniref:Uncharacterized protein n=1 Tax=Microscilla marina ATCC 23134 TaxID=313606 RepID=A1ZEC6_MICM2|nr:hypothetical protein [Microscilla marina]EAY31435.1 hypothetical protein M23134_04268 [Microscilla marina ATCC 23134]